MSSTFFSSILRLAAVAVRTADHTSSMSARVCSRFSSLIFSRMKGSIAALNFPTRKTRGSISIFSKSPFRNASLTPSPLNSISPFGCRKISLAELARK